MGPSGARLRVVMAEEAAAAVRRSTATVALEVEAETRRSAPSREAPGGRGARQVGRGRRDRGGQAATGGVEEDGEVTEAKEAMRRGLAALPAKEAPEATEEAVASLETSPPLRVGLEGRGGTGELVDWPWGTTRSLVKEALVATVGTSTYRAGGTRQCTG